MSIILTPDNSATLVSTARLTQNAQLSALNTANPNLVASMLSAATTAIQRETLRTLIYGTTTEYISGGNYPNQVLHLKEFPVVEITRVATNPQTVLNVTNGNSSLNQRATIETTAGGIRLFTMQSGVGASTDLLATSYLTIQLLANAVNALGGGWIATVQGAYANFPTADLRPMQGAYTTLNGGADLQIYMEEMGASASSNWSDDYGNDFGSSSMGWRLDAGAAILQGRFPRGQQNIRIDYTAGFAVMPADLEEACVQLILDFYNSSLADQTKRSESLGPYRYELNTMAGFMSPKVKAICSYYRDRGKLNLHF